MKPSFPLLESKLRRPAGRPGIVARAALVDRLNSVETPAVISVVAPAGYGKTTLLAQFAARTGTRTAWVSADNGDDDPFVLLSYIVEAVARVAGPRSRVEGPPRLASVIAAMQDPMTLIIDHFDSVTNWESWDVVAALALGLPPGSVAVAVRHCSLSSVCEAVRGVRESADGGGAVVIFVTKASI